MKAQRLIHATRAQERVAECANEPSGYGKRMNSKQAMDTYGSGARIRLRHHKLIPSQYKSGGSWVRGKRVLWSDGGEKGGAYSRVPAQTLLGEMSCWDDMPPKTGKMSWNY